MNISIFSFIPNPHPNPEQDIKMLLINIENMANLVVEPADISVQLL